MNEEKIKIYSPDEGVYNWSEYHAPIPEPLGTQLIIIS